MVQFNLDKNTFIIIFDDKPISPMVKILLRKHLGFQQDSYYSDRMYKKMSSDVDIEEVKEILIKNGYLTSESDNVKRKLDKVNEEYRLLNYLLEHGNDIKTADLEDLEIPNLERPLLPFQINSVYHLIKASNAANFSVTGSGKTGMVYAAYSYWKSHSEVNKMLVIGPRSCFMSWEDEFPECFNNDINSERLLGANRERIYNSFSEYDILFTTYQTASNDTKKLIKMLSRDRFLVVLDESHYIKRFEGGVWANAIIRIAPYAVKKIILTGTPMPQGFEDLYSQLTFLWPFTAKRHLGNRALYKKRIKDETNRNFLKEQISPLFYRIKKKNLMLKDPNYEIIPVGLSQYQELIYNRIEARTVEHIKKTKYSESSLLRRWRATRFIYLREAASNPGLLMNHIREDFELADDIQSAEGLGLYEIIKDYLNYERPEKILQVVSKVKELIDLGEKVVLWCYFRGNLHLIEKLLTNEGITFYPIHGDIPIKITEENRDDVEIESVNRETNIRNFRSTETPCVLIANPYACAESISLHKACHNAIYFDRDFNCGRYLQSLDRIHRIGLDPETETNYYLFICNNTIDTEIQEILEEKAEIMFTTLDDELPIGFFGEELDVETGTDEIEHNFERFVKSASERISQREK